MLEKEKANDSFAYFDQFNDQLKFEEPQIFTFMPGGGEGEHKKWGIQNFLELSSLILKNIPGSHIVFILGPMEKEEIQSIQASEVAKRSTILLNPEISTIASVSKQSVAVVANDCGPSHVAQMSGCNYVGVWGWEKQHPVARIAEWSYPSDSSVHIVAKFGQGIKTISPQRIFNIVKGFCNQN